MNNEKDKWSEKFRQKMQDYEEPVSDDLWQSIEKDLPKASRKPFIIYVSRIAAVAACLGLAFWGYTLLDKAPTENAAAPVMAESTDLQKEMQRNDNRPQQVLASDLLETQEEAIAQNAPQSRTIVTTEPKSDEVAAINNIEDTETAPQEDTVEIQPKESKQVEEKETEKPFTLFDNGQKKENRLVRQCSTTPQPKKSKSNNWGLSLAVNGSANNGSKSGEGFSPLKNKFSLGAHKLTSTSEDKFIKGYQNILFSNISQPTRTNVKYDFPLTYSAMFRYRINHRWGINAGLNFTQYTSEWESGTKQNYYTSKQKAYFIGVPVNVNFTIFDSRYFTLYALAGGSVEKSVGGNVKNTIISHKNKLETPTIKDGLESHPWQYSLNAGVGLQFNINKNYGIFAEPQVAKYFDNESLKVRKNDNAEFRLNVGLRFSY